MAADDLEDVDGFLVFLLVDDDIMPPSKSSKDGTCNDALSPKACSTSLYSVAVLSNREKIVFRLAATMFVNARC